MDEKKCKHIFTRISNCWFHWNIGDSMCIGRCTICGLTMDVKMKDIKS